MNKAVQIWRDGAAVWEIRNASGELIDTVQHTDDKDELVRRLQTCGTIDPAGGFVACKVIFTDEPRFLVRDESGRGFANELNYSEFTAEERGHIEDEDEPDDTLGEWLDNSSAGDEYQNTDENYTVIRIN
jgi:hypothetical protein